MSTLQALILGLVQGLTEFLPISSSAHLVIVPDLLGWEQPSTTFDVVLHAGTLVAVAGYFRHELLSIAAAFVGGDKRDAHWRRLGFLVAAGTVPAVVAGVLFEKRFEEFFLNPTAVAGFLLVTGILLIGTGLMIEASEDVGSKRRGITQVTVKDAVYIGLMQAMAIAPGISRSGSTIATGLFLGLGREAAARYSFLLSVPVIAGATVFSLRHGLSATGESVAALLVGFAAAALSGFAAIRFLMGFIRRHSLKAFAYYCWVLGGSMILWHFFR